MTRDDVKQAIIRALAEIVTISGTTLSPGWEFDESVRPIGDLEGFDSLNIVEAVLLISEFLGVEIKPELLLLLQDGDPPQLGVMIDRICMQIGIEIERPKP